MLRRPALGFAIASISVFALGGRAAANVLVVDAGGGGNFTTIQAAVDAALSGDTILVRAGTYAGFTVPDKTLSVVADTGAQVSVPGLTTVGNLAASHTIVLAGLHMTGTTSSRTPLFVSNVAGPVRVQGCTMTGATPGSPGLLAGTGASVLGGSTRVAFVGCTLRGGDAGTCDFCDEMPPGALGLEIVGARVAVYDCTVTGGEGSYSIMGFSNFVGGTGGDCASVSAGFLHASNSTITGGQGGYVLDCPGPTQGGKGGDGLHLFGGNPLPGAWSIGSTIQGGPGSPHITSGCAESAPGAPGSDVVTDSGTYFPLSGTRLEMDAPAVVREGNDLVLTLHGRPGAQITLLISSSTVFSAIPSWHGVRIAGNTGRLHPAMLLDPIPASGVLTTGIQIGDLPPGVASGTYFFQAFATSSEGKVLGSFAALTVLDSAY